VQSTRTDAGSGREFFFSPFKNRNRQTPDKLGTPIQAGRPRLSVYLLAVLLLVSFFFLIDSVDDAEVLIFFTRDICR